MRPTRTSAGHANPGPQRQERDTRSLESDESQLRNACSLNTLGNTQWPIRSDRPPDSITREDIPGFLDLKRHLTLFWAKVRLQYRRCRSLHLETKRKWAMPLRDPPPSALRGPVTFHDLENRRSHTSGPSETKQRSCAIQAEGRKPGCTETVLR